MSTLILQDAATANGNGTAHPVERFDNAQQLEVVESGGGTCTLTVEGSFEGSRWYALGYYQIDGTAALSRVATGISVTANTSHVYQILDPYPQVRARISSAAGGVLLNVRLFAI